MKTRFFLWLLLALALIAASASASDLQNAIAQLPDDQLVQLYKLVVDEMYHRNISFEETNANITHNTHETSIIVRSAPAENVVGQMLDIISYAQYALQNVAYSETVVSYDPPATPRPTFAPLIQLENTDTVWISRTGFRYHTTPDCSGMRDPSPSTLYLAITKGLTPCRDCAYWLPKAGE